MQPVFLSKKIAHHRQGGDGTNGCEEDKPCGILAVRALAFGNHGDGCHARHRRKNT